MKIIKAFIPLFTGYSLLTANAGTWNDQNRLAAEVWRKVDESYYDRTFGGSDWFGIRQELVQRQYSSDEEVYKSLQSALLKIGDKYTKFLPPNQYNTIMNSALGELCGIGVELENTDAGVRIVSAQSESPAAAAGLKTGDVVLDVDGTDSSALSAEEVAALIRYV